ncbi:TIM-barrel protein, nifR3 family [Natranaerobius thermophilus JW/NM-WN-LF]|uniref:tRNA-dihydrouridine synthase n=2 Tax=Natranaerobius TaxID=375928 RepID=B2A3T5_NATTJ|nr:TIM-barrel protein, nifR3 family [Natranaerobius thermophilus JW/NM-WN-LF]
MNKMKLGKLTLDNCIIVAPMAGVTDYPYRRILAKFSPGLICGEMVSAKGMVYGNKKTEEMVIHHNQGVHYSQQIFGSDPKVMADAAVKLENLGVDSIDVNMGCPAPKIVKNGEGSALLKKPHLAQEIVREIVNSVNLPVTVKIRKGFDRKSSDPLELALRLQEVGIKALAVHGRTCEQQYSGKADWEVVAKLKNYLDIPVIGNGDIFSSEDAVSALEMTACDGIMLGRGLMGNPWLIEQTKGMLIKDEKIESPEIHEIKNEMKSHFENAIKYYGESKGIAEMRKHISWYLKSLPGSTSIKDEVMRLTDVNQIWFSLNEYFQALEKKS